MTGFAGGNIGGSRAGLLSGLAQWHTVMLAKAWHRRDKVGRCGPPRCSIWKGCAASPRCRWCCFTSSSGSLPDAAPHAWPPLHVLFDGHTAVYVFFLISGAVLTPSFAGPGGLSGSWADGLCGWASRWPRPRPSPQCCSPAAGCALRAAALTGSAWLAMDSSGAPTFAHLAREIGLDSLLLGYREATLFTPLGGTPAADGAFARRAVLVAASGTIWLAAGAMPGIAARPVASGAPHRGRRGGRAVRLAPMFLFVLGHLASLLARRRTGAGPGGGGCPGRCCSCSASRLCATKDWAVVNGCACG